MRTVAIINQKGGCGKTTSAINLSACLARLGQKTLLVDMDPQGHCGTGLAVPEEQIERTIYDALLEPSDTRDGRVPRISDIVWQIASDFDLAPSNIRLAAFEQVFAGRAGREDRLGNALAAVKDNYKWCIIDCPPSVGLITFNALKACDEAIVPVETGYFSLHGLTKMMETLEMLRERAGKEITIRVLPTLYDTRTKLAREVLSELRARFKDYLMVSTVNFNTKLKEAASFGQPITEYDPGSRGYRDFVNLARELMGARPADPEIAPDKMNRPQELVQRARALTRPADYQFGRNAVPAIPQQQQTAGGSRMNGGTTFSLAPGSATAAAAPAMTAKLAPVSCIQRVATTATGPASLLQSTQPTRINEQRPIDFYGVKQFDDGVVFSARFDSARQVLIAGDFNNWLPMSTPMARVAGAGWSMKLPLPPGRYRYRFVVDGKWQTDPFNQSVETNPSGELNNVVEVA